MLNTVMILVLICVLESSAFNLSPKPNLVVREPPSSGMSKMRSSYFGLSVTLKRNR